MCKNTQENFRYFLVLEICHSRPCKRLLHLLDYNLDNLLDMDLIQFLQIWCSLWNNWHLENMNQVHCLVITLSKIVLLPRVGFRPSTLWNLCNVEVAASTCSVLFGPQFVVCFRFILLCMCLTPFSNPTKKQRWNCSTAVNEDHPLFWSWN